MNVKRLIVATAIALPMVLGTAGPAAASGCSGDGIVAVLYKKITGNELIHCP